jgi:hypothetical protein
MFNITSNHHQPRVFTPNAVLAAWLVKLYEERSSFQTDSLSVGYEPYGFPTAISVTMGPDRKYGSISRRGGTSNSHLSRSHPSFRDCKLSESSIVACYCGNHSSSWVVASYSSLNFGGPQGETGGPGKAVPRAHGSRNLSWDLF